MARRRLDGLHAPLPRYQIAMLRYFTHLHQTTVGDILARELEEVASANAAEVAAMLPGFAEALDWPGGEGAPLAGSMSVPPAPGHPPHRSMELLRGGGDEAAGGRKQIRDIVHPVRDGMKLFLDRIHLSCR